MHARTMCAAAMLMLGGCGWDPTGAGTYTSTVVINAPQLSRLQLVNTVSVIERVTLAADPGKVSPADQPFSINNASATFSAAVPAGDVTFRARILSNTGVALYGGQVTQNITDNGFQVGLPVDRVHAIPQVYPDTLDVRSGLRNVFRIFNVGVRDLTWAVSGTCTACAVTPAGGTIAAGQSDSVVVVPSFRQGTTRINPLRMTFNVGVLDLIVLSVSP